MNSKLDINAVFLTLKIASISTALTLIAAVLLVWGMENRSKKLRSIVEMLINLSLFISPTVLGYILIIFLGKRGIIGSYLYEFFNIQVIFSWWAGIITCTGLEAIVFKPTAAKIKIKIKFFISIISCF